MSSCVRRLRIFECRSGRITGPARARGDTMALSVLAERLLPRSHRKCQPPEFRMKWKFASTWDVRDPGHSESRLSRFKNSHEVDFLGAVHCAISACKRSENKLSGMNTCAKRVGGGGRERLLREKATHRMRFSRSESQELRGAKGVRRERHGHQELRGAKEDRQIAKL